MNVCCLKDVGVAMSKIHEILVILLVLVVFATTCQEAVNAGVSDVDKKAVVEGNNAFAVGLYAELRDRDDNLFFSPHSISTALAMTYGGARGETAAQMAKALHFELESKRLHPAFRTLQEDLIGGGRKRGYELSIANALWGQKGYGFLREFLDLTKTCYGSGFQEVDFVNATETARKTINAWVEKRTRDKIKELIRKEPPILNTLTVLVLTNAIYFKGNWTSQFDEKLTKDAPFMATKERKINVPMMHQEGEFKYMEADALQALELPYVDNELSMTVLLPRKVDGLTDLENLLTADNLNKWVGSLRKKKIVIYLPKFKMTCDFRLEEDLMSMGMTDAFSGAADFSGMAGNKELFISAVLHKAFVDVNEEGTEAAAATAVVMEKARKEAFLFRADHPFIFLIRDNRSGSILFIGRVVNPLE